MLNKWLLTFLLVGASNVQAEVITDWNLTGAAGNEAFITSASNASNISGLNLTRGTGLNPSAAGNSFSSNGWNGEATDYFSFGFSVANGFEVDLTDLYIGTRSSNTGPGALGLFYSGDNFTSNLYTFTQSGTNFTNSIVDLTALNDLSGLVEFRIFGLGNTSANGGTLASNGTFRIAEHFDGSTFTNVQFNGAVSSVAAIPEPETYAMFLAGLALLGFASRRNQK